MLTDLALILPLVLVDDFFLAFSTDLFPAEIQFMGERLLRGNTLQAYL